MIGCHGNRIISAYSDKSNEIIIVAPSGDKISNFETDRVKGPLSYLIWKFGRANTLIGWIMMVRLKFPTQLYDFTYAFYM